MTNGRVFLDRKPRQKLTRLGSSDDHGRRDNHRGVDGADGDEAGRDTGAAAVDQVKAFDELCKYDRKNVLTLTTV